MLVRYNSNNSGGRWWLTDENWKCSEAAGWAVEWVANDTFFSGLPASLRKKDRYLGALARAASKEFDSPAEGMREFERITGQNVMDDGCSCCGAPHEFSWGEGANRGYASGSECGSVLFPGEPATLREALEELSQRES